MDSKKPRLLSVGQLQFLLFVILALLAGLYWYYYWGNISAPPTDYPGVASSTFVLFGLSIFFEIAALTLILLGIFIVLRAYFKQTLTYRSFITLGLGLGCGLIALTNGVSFVGNL